MAQELQDLRAGDGVGTETFTAQGKSRPRGRRPMMRLWQGRQSRKREELQNLVNVDWFRKGVGWGRVGCCVNLHTAPKSWSLPEVSSGYQ